MEEAVLGLARKGTTTRGQYNAPTDTFETKDGFITVQVVGGGLFKRWATLMGEEHWLNDERFSSDQSRGDHGQLIGERMAQWCATRTNAEALAEMAKAGIPCGEMLSPNELLQNKHVVETNMLKSIEYPGVSKPAPVAEHPVRYSKTSVDEFNRAPTLSEHTEQILKEVDFTDQEIVRFKEAGVI